MANPLLWEKERNSLVFFTVYPLYDLRRFSRLVGKSLSTLITTTFQHSSACRRSHSFTESVYFASLSFLGLVSSFHNLSPCLRFYLATISYFSYFIFVFFSKAFLLYRKQRIFVKQFCLTFSSFLCLLRNFLSFIPYYI